MSVYQCLECGVSVGPDAEFCPKCGVEFEDGPSTWERIKAGIGLAVMLTALGLFVAGGVWFVGFSDEDSSTTTGQQSQNIQAGKPQPESEGFKRSLRSEVFVFNDYMRTQVNMPVSTIQTVLEKMNDFEAGLSDDTTELRQWIEDAQEGVRTAGLVMEREKIPEGLPDILAGSLKKWKTMLVEINRGRGKILAALLAELDSPGMGNVDVEKLALRVQAKQEQANKLINETFESARRLDMVN